MVAFIDRVIGLSGNYTSYTSTRIRVVSCATWNEMNVAVHHGLASDLAAVDPYVETQDGWIFLKHEGANRCEQLLAGTHFGHSKIKIICRMPFRDNEYVPLGHRVLVLQDHGEAILKQNLSVASRAEGATGFYTLIRRPNGPEVGVITVSLHGIAGVTERLKVGDLVPTALVSRRYVVDFQSALVSRDATKFATELGVL
jgi:hypothetical protein